jgi:hypothetical protein
VQFREPHHSHPVPSSNPRLSLGRDGSSGAIAPVAGSPPHVRDSEDLDPARQLTVDERERKTPHQQAPEPWRLWRTQLRRSDS